MAFSSAQQWYYLSDFLIVNTLEVGSKTLDTSEVTLLDNSPSTNQATTVSVSTSISTNIGGRGSFNQSSGGAGSFSAGVSWGTSDSYSKANVSINNKSLSESNEATDASWEYAPAAADVGGQKNLCNNLGLRGLADLSHETFTPDDAFIYQISSDYAGETIKLKSKVTYQMRQNFVGSCNVFGCSCSLVTNNEEFGPFDFTHYISLPATPDS